MANKADAGELWVVHLVTGVARPWVDMTARLAPEEVLSWGRTADEAVASARASLEWQARTLLEAERGAGRKEVRTLEEARAFMLGHDVECRLGVQCAPECSLRPIHPEEAEGVTRVA